jgi:hypothetical protein
MSLSIFEHGDGRFRLVHDDREVGWLENRTLTIADFPDAATARDAASTAYDALSAWLSRQRHVDAKPRRGRALKIRPGDADRALMLGGVRVGRLVDASVTSPAHGFELALPPRLTATLVAAQVIYEALLKKEAVHPFNAAAAAYVPAGGPAGEIEVA